METVQAEIELKLYEPRFKQLLPALQRLDHLLERAVAAAQAAYGSQAAVDLYRGLYISAEDCCEFTFKTFICHNGPPFFKVSNKGTH